MKKIALSFTLILSIIFILSGCLEAEQGKGSQVNEPETKTQNAEVPLTTEKQNEEEADAEFHTEIPSIKKISSKAPDIILDNSYQEVCWRDCDDNRTYNYPDIHSGEVEAGDRILIDWRTMKPIPSEVNLIRVNSLGEEISKENINTDSSTLNIQVSEEEIGKQYAVQFLWKDGEKLQGHSVLNYKLK
ncbi:hypothetical protein SAMN05421743_101358 [Thalassobacillus cyri]|uniref:Lipoprotein n=1 Tax=Thalassobacillus cyri TaxID=571932 RepID=A0A1H3W931_9BACI|nr:hypothetical protein [Thalassobacillus cyri]SDZ83361.1 hypothetical protein SAMN05421743_101358 [Thalassobacillus cyri]